MGPSPWYPYSGATHHVCKEDSALNESTYYLGTAPILMGDGTRVLIKSIGSSTLAVKKVIASL